MLRCIIHVAASGGYMVFFKAFMLADMAVRIGIVSLAAAFVLAVCNLVTVTRKNRDRMN